MPLTRKKETESKQSEAELEKRIRERVKCEEKAFRIVEKLAEISSIAQTQLIDYAQYITPSHYDDITEERSISQLCGYPVCSNSTASSLKQKYYISLRHNKVYDITERKKFCSNRCYKASDYVRKQISMSPVWLRDNEDCSVKLLDECNNKGKVGIVMTEDVPQAAQLLLDDDDEDECVAEANGQHHQEKNGNDGVVGNIAQQVAKFLSVEDNSGDGGISGGGEITEHVPSLDARNAAPTVRFTDGVAAIDKSSGATDSSSNLATKAEQLMHLLDQREQLITLKENKTVRFAGTSGKCNELPACTTHAEQDSTAVVPSNTKYCKTDDGALVRETTQEHVPGTRDTHCSDASSSDTKDSGTKTLHSQSEATTACRSRAAPMHTNRGSSQDRSASSAKVILANIQNIKKQNMHSTRTASDKKVGYEKIETCLLQWKTQETVQYLTSSAHGDTGWTEEMQTRAMMMSEKARVLEKFLDSDDDKSDDDEDHRTPAGKLPDYNELQKQTKEYSMRIQEYLSGHMTPVPADHDATKQETASGKEKQHGVDDEDNTPDPLLPIVDSQSPMALRRQIVLDKINIVLPDLLAPLKLLVMDVSTEIRQLVFTFALSKDNISFKPAEWSLLVLILLHLLSGKIDRLDKALKSPKNVVYDNILQIYMADKNRIHKLCETMKNR